MHFRNVILTSTLAFIASTSFALPQNISEREAFEIIERATLAPVYTTCVTVRNVSVWLL